MSRKPSRMMQGINEIHGLRRPSVVSLLGHILSSIISSATAVSYTHLTLPTMQ